MLTAEPSGNYCSLWTSQAADQIKRLYDLFLKVDATQVEVNPLGETPEGQGTSYRRKCLYLCVCVLTFLSLFLSLIVLNREYNISLRSHPTVLITDCKLQIDYTVLPWV